MRPSEANLEQVRHFLRRQGGAFLNPKGLLERVRDGARLPSVLLARMCLEQLRDQGELACEAWSSRGPEARVQLRLSPVQIGETEAAWQKAVSTGVHDESDRTAYYAFWPALLGWPPEDYAVLVAEIEALRRTRPYDRSSYLFSASGRLASSKLLVGLPKQALRMLGIDVDVLAPGPTYFIIAGPRTPEVVILVENPNAFERAVRVTADMPVAWISAYGFGATTLDGARLIDGLADVDHVVSVVRAGDPPTLGSLISMPRLLYWGDLDLAGLQIFHAVRHRFPNLQLSALMQPMIDRLRSGGGHPYASLTGKEGQREWQCSDAELLPFLDLCRRRAADQECVSDQEIRELALKALSLRRCSVDLQD